MTSATAIGFSSLRSVNAVSPLRACATPTFGSSLIGGSASTRASSSGLGGTEPIMPSMWLALAARRARRWRGPPPRFRRPRAAVSAAPPPRRKS